MTAHNEDSVNAHKTILVTGGAGFIGSNFVLDWIGRDRGTVVNLDKLTYAGNLANLDQLRDNPRHVFVRGDIADQPLAADLFARYQPSAVVHFAAESHVDRSIHGPEDFVQTNVVGTFRLLESVRAYFGALTGPARERFRFLHVSTDEVFGSLGPQDPPFSETTPYAPNSPYSASKAASDHLVRAYLHTYQLPVITTNCSNNYGPYQFPEKLIPLMIVNALREQPLPVYGDGMNVRDWLYVGDHCEALGVVLQRGRAGETYNIGGNCEQTNLSVVQTVCRVLDERMPRPGGAHYEELISYVTDRPGHDRRYAIDSRKLQGELGWSPRESFVSGMSKTVQWYLTHREWTEDVINGAYRSWVDVNYRQRAAM